MTDIDSGVEIIYGPFKPPPVDAPIDQDTSVIFHQWVHGKPCSDTSCGLTPFTLSNDQSAPPNDQATPFNTQSTPFNTQSTPMTVSLSNPMAQPSHTTTQPSPTTQDTPLNTPILKRSSPSIYIHSKAVHTSVNQQNATASSGYYTDITGDTHEDTCEDSKVSCKTENPVDPPKPHVCPLQSSADSPVDLGVIDLNAVYEEMKRKQQDSGVFKLQRPNVQHIKTKVMNYRNKIAQRLPRTLHNSPTRRSLPNATPSTSSDNITNRLNNTSVARLDNTSVTRLDNTSVTRLDNYMSRLSCQSPIRHAMGGGHTIQHNTQHSTQHSTQPTSASPAQDSEKKDRRFTFLQLDGKSNGQLLYEFVNLINCGSAANMEYTNYWYNGILVPTVFDYLFIIPFNVSYPSRKEDRDLLRFQLWNRTYKHVTQENIGFLRSVIFN